MPKKVIVTAPKIATEFRIELAEQIADAMTEMVAKQRGFTVWATEGELAEEGRMTEEAQEVFEPFYDKAHAMIDDVFGTDDEPRVLTYKGT